MFAFSVTRISDFTMPLDNNDVSDHAPRHIVLCGQSPDNNASWDHLRSAEAMYPTYCYIKKKKLFEHAHTHWYI